MFSFLSNAITVCHDHNILPRSQANYPRNIHKILTTKKQAEAELGQAQRKLGLDFTSTDLLEN